MSTYLVVNPTKVDDVDALLAQVTEAQGTAPVLLRTTEQDAGEQLTRQAVAAGATLVLAAGGDGTVRAVCCGLRGTGVPLGLLPLGTGNLLARNLDLPLDLEDALEVALHGRERTLDLGLLSADGTETCFVVMAGLGFDAQMMADAPEAVKARLGWPAYVVSGLRHLRDEPRQLEVSYDGGAPVQGKARGLVIGNVGTLQAGVALLPDALPDDGVLDVVVLAPQSLRHWAGLALRLLTRSAKQDRLLTRHTATVVEVRCAVPLEAQVDGDGLGRVRTLRVEVVPAGVVVKVAS